MAKRKRDDDALQDSSGGSMAVNDAWTGMLAISLLALMIGTGFLLWEYLSYPDALPKVPTLTSRQPGTPAVAEPKKDEQAPPKKE